MKDVGRTGAKAWRALAGVAALALLISCQQQKPALPTIEAFTATPSSIEAGETSTLAWSVTGATNILIEAVGGDTILDTTDATGNTDVTPTTTTQYQLTASNTTGNTTATVTVTVTGDGVGVVNDLTAAVVAGSQLDLAWTGDAVTFDVFAVDGGGIESPLATGITATDVTVPIPASGSQTIRVYARGALADTSADLSLAGLPIVVLGGDYDPYDSLGFTPETPIPGTLRWWIDEAPPGTIIGFAADIDEIDVYGVDLVDGFDSHLIFRTDVTVSGPSSRVTVRARSAYLGPEEDIAFTYRSRVMLVRAGVTVTLENLVVTGGTYISNGAGVANRGTLTVRSSEISGNRAWDKGGGLFNAPGSVLEVIDSLITGNQAVTLADEANALSVIRNVDPVVYPEAEFLLPDGGYGGGLFVDTGGTVTVSGTAITANYAKLSGGAAYLSPTAAVAMTASPVSGNLADHEAVPPPPAPAFTYFSFGGGIVNLGTLTFSGADVSGNEARDQGGGLYVDPDSTSTFSGLAFSGNEADFGGAIRQLYCDTPDNLTLTGVTFSGNVGRVFADDISSEDVCPLVVPPGMVPDGRPGLVPQLDVDPDAPRRTR